MEMYCLELIVPRPLYNVWLRVLFHLLQEEASLMMMAEQDADLGVQQKSGYSESSYYYFLFVLEQ